MNRKQFLTPVVVLSLLAISGRGASADKIQVTRKVLLPDGKPAAGIPILIRTFDLQESRLGKEIKTVTDAEGVFAAEVEIASQEEITRAKGRPPQLGYVIVDAPDSVLTLINLNLWRDSNSRWREPLRLGAGYVLGGRVTAQGKPVAGADVALSSLSGWWVNDPSAGIATPQLTTKSGADGNYETRPVLLAGNASFDDNGYIMGSAVASATIEGQHLSGSTANQVLVRVGAPPAHPGARGDIALGSTWTARGKVVNALNGQPVAGATVRVAARSVTPLTPATTNANGEWEVTGIPPVFEMLATATHPQMSIGWAPIGERLGQLDDQARQPKTFGDVLIKLRPMTTITGRVVEEETGQMPVAVLPGWNVARQARTLYERGTQFGNEMLGRGWVEVPLQPDGQFSLPVAVGENSVSVEVPLYEAVEPRLNLNIGPEGQKELLLKVRKRPYFYVRLEAERPEEMKDLSISMRSEKYPADKYPEGVSTGQYRNGDWATPAGKWGETVEIRVRRGSGKDFKEIVPWTKITADPKNWPLVIRLPQQAPAPIPPVSG